MTRVYKYIQGFIITRRRLVVALFHIILASLANYFAFVLRFEHFITRLHDEQYFSLFVQYLPLLLVIRIVLYLQAGMHKDMWKYASVKDLIKIIRTVTLGSLIFFVLVKYVFGDIHYPRSIYIIDWFLLIAFSGGSRLLVRVMGEYLRQQTSGRAVLIIGAGDAGEMVARDMRNNARYNMKPIGFIDDDPGKKGLRLHGLPVFGPREMIPEVIERYSPDEILIAMPAMSSKVLREVYAFCRSFYLPVKTLPGLHDIVEGKVTVSQIRPLSLEDLLQREPLQTDIREVSEFIKGKTVLVTGAGGSIGSELCRQILSYRPGKLIMFDRYENGLFSIDMELRAAMKSKGIGCDTPARPSATEDCLVTVISDMTDRGSVEALFEKQRPQIVFHAAAHKHVPLMELNPLEAVKNNVFGTNNLIEAAVKYDVDRFVMISTDKAVNPTNVMGATKRVAEFLCMGMNHDHKTKFTTVRFGNVLGSNGSVVTIFREQIKQGGPLTVTHPDIKRFFMLIPEAVQLVLMAASSGKGGEIFVLEMGEQIKITDLAENVIILSGFTPHEDIEIEYTGLRPGEKLYEELFDKTETESGTANPRIRAAIPACRPTDEELQQYLSSFSEVIRNNDVEGLMRTLGKIVPNFKTATTSKE